MPAPTRLLLLVLVAHSIRGQAFVYSGREYQIKGRTWMQIREMDTVSGRRLQLTNSFRDHARPWCGPDSDSILFGSGLGKDRGLFRFDRATGTEVRLITLDQDLFEVVGAIDDSRIVVQEYGAVIEIIDVRARQKLRRISGVGAAISSDRQLIAYQSSTDPLARVPEPTHVYLTGFVDEQVNDIGIGAGPSFRPNGGELSFVQLDPETQKGEIIHYDLRTRQRRSSGIPAPQFFGRVFGFSISPDGTTTILATDGGGYGSALYWLLGSNGKWAELDDSLSDWSGWSTRGQLLFATAGRDTRPLDKNRAVWVSDIKLFDQRSRSSKTLVSGVSWNASPRWCPH